MRYETVSSLVGMERTRHLHEAAFAEAGVPCASMCIEEPYYAELEKYTKSFFILAYDGEELAGFVSVFVVTHQHTCEPVATNDVIFVRHKYRSGVLAGRLFVMAEREAAARGAVSFQWQAPVRSPLFKTLLARTPDRSGVQVTFTRPLR